MAVVATARKLVTIAWHMLKDNQPYRYAQPSTLEAKFARLRIRVTGQRRRSGNKKGEPRTAQYGKGRTKAVPTIDSVYAREQLPDLAPLSPGESASLVSAGLDQWEAALHQPRRKSKRTSASAPAPAIP